MKKISEALNHTGIAAGRVLGETPGRQLTLPDNRTKEMLNMIEEKEVSLQEALKKASETRGRISQFVSDLSTDSEITELPEELKKALANRKHSITLEMILDGLILLDELERTSETRELSNELYEFKKLLNEKIVKLEKVLECSKLLAV